MNAVLSADADADEVQQPMQLEMLGRPPLEKPPAVCRALMGGPNTVGGGRHSRAAEAARKISNAQRADMERIARTPIVPLSWIRGATQVTPEEAGERKAGRPPMNVRRNLCVDDLDQSLTYLQRRTRELSRLVKETHPSSEHATKIIKGAIKDAIRKLSANLPQENRDEIDMAVAKV